MRREHSHPWLSEIMIPDSQILWMSSWITNGMASTLVRKDSRASLPLLKHSKTTKSSTLAHHPATRDSLSMLIMVTQSSRSSTWRQELTKSQITVAMSFMEMHSMILQDMLTTLLSQAVEKTDMWESPTFSSSTWNSDVPSSSAQLMPSWVKSDSTGHSQHSMLMEALPNLLIDYPLPLESMHQLSRLFLYTLDQLWYSSKLPHQQIVQQSSIVSRKLWLKDLRVVISGLELHF